MLVLLVFLILWPIAEIFVAIQVGGVIGALPTILLLLASFPLGLWVLRSHGSRAWRRFSDAVAQRGAGGRPPSHAALDGALVLIAGVLLMIPGFITDVIALVLLVPPTRALMRRGVLRNLQSRLVVQAVRFGRGVRSYDVDSTARDIDQPSLNP